jgi:rubrerythrin
MTLPALTRRELGLGAVALPFALAIEDAFAKTDGQLAILRAAVNLEQKAVLTYRLAAPKLNRAEARLAELLRGQEQKHADGLTMALRNRGGRPPPKPTAPGQVPGLEQALAGDRRTILAFAIGLEDTAVAAYGDALRKLRDPRLLSPIVSILGNEGQHLAVLRQALGEQPVPGAFERRAR